VWLDGAVGRWSLAGVTALASSIRDPIYALTKGVRHCSIDGFSTAPRNSSCSCLRRRRGERVRPSLPFEPLANGSKGNGGRPCGDACCRRSQLFECVAELDSAGVGDGWGASSPNQDAMLALTGDGWCRVVGGG